MIDISIGDFPSGEGLEQYIWAPIFMNPILESPERLVVGVAAQSPHDSKVVIANSLSKLLCLYENADMEFLVFSAKNAVEELDFELSQKKFSTLGEFRFSISAFSIGNLSTAEGFTADQVATSLLKALSSLHSSTTDMNLGEKFSPVAEVLNRSTKIDKLPLLVHEQMQLLNPDLAKHFSSEIRNRRKSRAAGEASKVRIDYTGRRIIANFGTLRTANFSNSIDGLKRRLWDLKVFRDTASQLVRSQDHELFVHHMAANDPQLKQGDANKIKDSIQQLEEQADTEQVRFRPFTSVELIANQLIELEQAA